MHYLVTGGSGFIGRQFCAYLSREGNAVSVLTRHAPQTKRVLDQRVTVVETLDAVDVPVDVVVNLAGANLAEKRWTASRKKWLVDSRVRTTRKLVDWMSTLQTRPRALVSGSAIGWYGSDREDEVLSEANGPGTDFPAQLCQQWEKEALRAEDDGIRVCCVRTGVVLGFGGGALSKMNLPFKLGLGGPIGAGKQWMSWIAMNDMIRVLHWLSENEKARGSYNATSPNPARNEDFARALGSVLHRPALLRAPAVALRVLLGEMSELIIKGQNVVPRRLVSEGFQFGYPDLREALAESISQH